MIRRTLGVAAVLLIWSTQAPASTFFRCANGNWGGANMWSLVSTTTACVSATAPTASDDCIFDSGTPNGTTTVNVAATCKNLWMDGSNGGNGSAYAGTLTATSNLTTAGATTLSGSMTITGAGSLLSATSSTFTSNGKTWPGGLAFTGTTTITFADDWTVTGLVAPGSANLTMTLNGHNLNMNGGITVGTSGTLNGTTVLVLKGGTWSGPGGTGITNSLTFQGNSTVSGTVNYSTGTMTYTSGTVTTTGSTLSLGTSLSLPSGVTWNNLTLAAGTTLTLTAGTTSINGNLTMGSGATVINGGTLNIGGNLTQSGGSTPTLSGTTLLVFNGTGTISAASGWTLKSSVTINTAGTITWSGAIKYNTGTLTYVAGTVTTTSSTLSLTGSATLNTGALSWNNITDTTTSTLTLLSKLTYTGTFTQTISTTLTLAGSGAASAFQSDGTSGSHVAFKSSSGGTVATLSVSSGCEAFGYVDVTDITATGGAVFKTRGTISNSTGWSSGGGCIVPGSSDHDYSGSEGF